MLRRVMTHGNISTAQRVINEEFGADVGLVNERDSGGFYDKFRNRIMFPIRDAAGKMTGFGARILDPNDIPKFLNSPQTVLCSTKAICFTG